MYFLSSQCQLAHLLLHAFRIFVNAPCKERKLSLWTNLIHKTRLLDSHAIRFIVVILATQPVITIVRGPSGFGGSPFNQGSHKVSVMAHYQYCSLIGSKCENECRDRVYVEMRGGFIKDKKVWRIVNKDCDRESDLKRNSVNA